MDNASKGKDIIVNVGEIDNDSERRALLFLPPLARIRHAQRNIQALIIAMDEEELHATERQFDKIHARRAQVTSAALGRGRNHWRESRLFNDAPELIFATSSRIIDHIRRNSIDLSGVRTCVISAPPSKEVVGFHADMRFIFSKLRHTPQVTVFTGHLDTAIDDLKPLLRRPALIDGKLYLQEENTMKNNRFRSLMNDALVQKKIQSALSSIQEEEDPEELNAYRRLFKRRVHIFRRTYFGAYLLKQFLGQRKGKAATERDSSSTRRSSSGTRRGGGQSQRKPSSPRVTTPILVENGKFASVYVSAGRNSHVSRRDLVELFTDVDGMNEDSIGNIQVLDNFSFMEIATEVASKAIEALDGSNLRGRRLAVAYARSKPRSVDQ